MKPLIGVMETTVKDWRDERGEYGERKGPIAFHVIWSNGLRLLERLKRDLEEPVCVHGPEGDGSSPRAGFPENPTNQ